MKVFQLQRDVDTTGVSGTGVVAKGVAYNDMALLRWRNEPATSVGLYRDMATVIHIHGHDGDTRVEWLPEEHRLPTEVYEVDRDVVLMNAIHAALTHGGLIAEELTWL